MENSLLSLSVGRENLVPAFASLNMSKRYQSCQKWRLITEQSLQGADRMDITTITDER